MRTRTPHRGLLWVLCALPAVASAADPERGAAIAALAGCASCHTAEGGPAYAGGHAVETPFGTFYGTNLTPDPEHGLGSWTEADLARALRHGRGPDGTRYWPAFPFPAFTAMSDQDVADIWAHLQAQAPVAQADRPHEVSRGRWQLGLWRPLAFRPRGPLDLDLGDPTLERGAYLVHAVAHCGECHTPRGSIGGTRDRRFLGGSDLPPEPGPNLTPHPGALGAWTLGPEAAASLATSGMTAEGDWVGGQMMRVVEDGTAPLSDGDRRAMAMYLMQVDPVKPKGWRPEVEDQRQDAKEAWE